MWGTANAQTVTLSFWVRSSLTGTFGGVVTNGSYNRSYPFSYTITTANTWEYETITITGDTTGTWLTNNGNGLYLSFDLGSGTSYRTTAGSWVSSYYTAPTGATSVLATNGATFYITGIQLEKGTTSTPFDFRSHGTELALCQRYYVRVKPDGAGNPFQGAGVSYTTSNARITIPYPVQMRAVPTALEQSGTASNYSVLQNAWQTCTGVPTFSNASLTAINITLTASGLLVSGYGAIARDESGSAYLGWSAEL
jgi:hypothetical protein